MKIDNNDVQFIQNAIKVADLVNIINLSFEPTMIRGIDENHTVFILNTEDLPVFEFGSLGLNRLSEFTARLNLARGTSDFSLDATVEPNNGSPFVRAVTMKGKKLKAEYRCANPLTIQAPKRMKAPKVCTFTFSDDTVSFLTQGATAYKATNVTLIGNEDGVAIQMADINSDKMTYTVSNDLTPLNEDGDPYNFTCKYPIKTLSTLLKAADTATVVMDAQNILTFKVNNLSVHVFAVQ